MSPELLTFSEDAPIHQNFNALPPKSRAETQLSPASTEAGSSPNVKTLQSSKIATESSPFKDVFPMFSQPCLFTRGCPQDYTRFTEFPRTSDGTHFHQLSDPVSEASANKVVIWGYRRLEPPFWLLNKTQTRSPDHRCHNPTWPGNCGVAFSGTSPQQSLRGVSKNWGPSEIDHEGA